MSTAYDPLAPDDSFADKPVDRPRKRPNVVVHYASKIYNPLGFKKWYNFVLFFIFAQALFYFCWYNIRKVDVSGYWIKHASPSEQFYFVRPRYSIGMQMHLGCILPGGILAALQFLPVLRHKVIWFHRINGWVVTLLLMVGTDSQTVKGNEADRHLAQVSNAGAIMILRRAMGGRYDTLVFGGILGIFTTVSAWMGIINIKLKQIDQHRKWMMRTWVYAASIISLRFVQLASVQVIGSLRGYYVNMPCDMMEFMGSNLTYYPQCTAGGTETAVEANMSTPIGPEGPTAAFQLVFGQAGLVAFVIHAVLIEVYFHLTPAESERLRKIAYDRQLERGHKHPGSSGLTSDRLGDAEWWRPSTKIDGN